MNQTSEGSEDSNKVPKPPKKPLSPYMKYCKSIWKQVKGNNPSMSICQAGASIGRLWRELSDSDKKKYMDSFAQDKAEYEVALQSYLKLTGLPMSEVVKTKSRKKDLPVKSRTVSAASPSSSSKPVLRSATLSQVSSSACAPPGGQCVATTMLMTHHDQSIKSSSGQDLHVIRSIGQDLAIMRSTSGQDHLVIRSSGGQAMTTSLMSSLPHINQMLITQTNSLIEPGGQNFVTTLDKSISPESEMGEEQDNRSCVMNAAINSSENFTRFKSKEELMNNNMEGNENGFISNSMISGRQTLLDMQDDDIEDGEVVKNSRRIALFYESIASRVFDSETTKHQTASAHNVFNSYAYNPWVDVRLNAKSDSPTIYSPELMLQTELDHLRLLLNDKTNEAEELTERLRQAQSTIELLKLEMGCLDTAVTIA